MTPCAQTTFPQRTPACPCPRADTASTFHTFGRITPGKNDCHTTLEQPAARGRLPSNPAHAGDPAPAEKISGCTPLRGHRSALLCRLKDRFEVRGTWMSMSTRSRALRADFHHSQAHQKDEAGLEVKKDCAQQRSMQSQKLQALP